MEKQCEKCNQIKPYSEFGRSGKLRERTKRGEILEIDLTKKCKSCIKKRNELVAFNKKATTHKYCTSCYELKPIEAFWAKYCCGDCIKSKQTEEQKADKRLKTREYCKNNPEWKKATMKAYMRKQSEELTDTYIKIALNGKYKIPFSEITEELIENQRAIKLLRRTCGYNRGNKLFEKRKD